MVKLAKYHFKIISNPMQLNKFTDYALRLVVYVSRPSSTPYTISGIARALSVSEHHLVKIVHFLAKAGIIETTRGKGGGLRLSESALPLRLGDVVRMLQADPQIVDCHKPPCVFRFNCGLKPVLDEALNCFYEHLNQYNLAEVVALMNQTQNRQQSQTSDLAATIHTLNLDDNMA